MKCFIMQQLESFNLLMFLLIVLFNVILSRMNMNKQLKEQSQELYNEFEEIKDTIRENKK